MKLLPTNTKLGEESKQQLTELGNKLKPYLKVYQESRGAIAHIYIYTGRLQLKKELRNTLNSLWKT